MVVDLLIILIKYFNIKVLEQYSTTNYISFSLDRNKKVKLYLIDATGKE